MVKWQAPNLFGVTKRGGGKNIIAGLSKAGPIYPTRS